VGYNRLLCTALHCMCMHSCCSMDCTQKCGTPCIHCVFVVFVLSMHNFISQLVCLLILHVLCPCMPVHLAGLPVSSLHLSWIHAASVVPGQDPHDATSSAAPVTDFAAALPSVDSLNSKPLRGKRIGVIAEMMQGSIAPGVISAVQNSIKHLESLGAEVSEVSSQ